MSKKIVFFGNEKLATGLPDPKPLIREAIVRAGFEIEQHITGPLTDLSPHESKIAVLASYGRIIPQSVLDEFPMGIINIHPSLLPQYRGTTPIEQAILDGLNKTGVSIMRLTAGMDEGPIYKQKSIPLQGAETKAELAERLHQLGAELLLEALPGIINGQLKARQQPHPDRATYTKKLSKEDGAIDWEKPADQIEREIRAYSGWPKSYAKLGNVDVIITKAHSVPVDHSPPGTIEIDEDTPLIAVYCGNGSLCIDMLQPVGKREMTATAFLAGYKKRLI